MEIVEVIAEVLIIIHEINFKKNYKIGYVLKNMNLFNEFRLNDSQKYNLSLLMNEFSSDIHMEFNKVLRTFIISNHKLLSKSVI